VTVFRTPKGLAARSCRLGAVAMTTLLIGACAGGTESVSYKPPLVPIVFSLDSNGTFSVSASASVATPVGTFSAGAEVSRPLANDKTRVSIIHSVDGTRVQDVYDLGGRGPLVLCLNGWFSSRVDEKHVDIEALDGVSRVGLLGADSGPSDCARLVGSPDTGSAQPRPGPIKTGYGQVLGPAVGAPMPLMSRTHWPSNIVGTVQAGQVVEIECTAQGDVVRNPVGGVSTLWDKVGPGFIPDAYTFTGTDQPVAQQCS
jgi:hypothetical protein